ncbi:hypothetical protein ACS5PN_16450 [Roseateles sp. NT4]|uniref:hypothetical protein n=1 Tax=Roseateles sp. NT4 TaxID=3453715 RepID=UPI003EEE9C2D
MQTVAGAASAASCPQLPQPSGAAGLSAKQAVEKGAPIRLNEPAWLVTFRLKALPDGQARRGATSSSKVTLRWLFAVSLAGWRMQAIESAELSLAAFKERAGFPSARRWIRKPRRDIADALMTAFWANRISSECGDEILMLRYSALRGEAHAAFYWGKYIWRMMLLLGPSFVEGGIAQALADLLEERIMPMATVRDERFGFPSGSFNSLVWQYVATIYQVLRLPPGTLDDRLHATGQGILNGAFGSAYAWIFNPARLTTFGGPPNQ